MDFTTEGRVKKPTLTEDRGLDPMTEDRGWNLTQTEDRDMDHIRVMTRVQHQ